MASNGNLDSIEAEIETLAAKIRKAVQEKAVLTNKINAWTKQKDALVNQINLNNLEKKSSVDWSAESFEWSERIRKILQNTFKLKDFRSQQLSAINATLSKHDILLLMPTGAGKTLCYQLPAIAGRGLTLVVSPLISLMEDQLLALKRLGIHAVAMSPSTDKDVKKDCFEYLNKGTGKVPKFMYVTPEFLSKSKRLMAGLQKCFSAGNFDRIAIDEVHCCSQWGHDFRTDYNYLGLLKNIFPDVPILGVTATATNNVLVDIQQMLNLDCSLILRAPFDRPNLNFQVQPKPDNNEDIYDVLTKLLRGKYKGQSGIIYAGTINDCIDITKQLRSNNIRAGCYHAHIEKETRSKVHAKWLKNEYQVIVATVAFGMGIDKADVRYVIHSTMPKSMETLYQEAGRAGRDGESADHLVLFRLVDYLRISGNTKSKTEVANVLAVLRYCLNCTTCRHKLLADAFEQELLRKHCSACDNCNMKISTAKYNLYSVYKDLYNIIKKADTGDPKTSNLTLIKLVALWDKGGDGGMKKRNMLTHEQLERIIAELILQGYLVEEKNFTPYSVNTYLRTNRNISVKDISNIASILPVKANLDHCLKRVDVDENEIDCEKIPSPKRIKLS